MSCCLFERPLNISWGRATRGAADAFGSLVRSMRLNFYRTVQELFPDINKPSLQSHALSSTLRGRIQPRSRPMSS